MTAIVRKAVFPVAGLGTRMLPATKALPKEMLPVVDKPVIQYALEEAKEAGIEEFIFVTGRGKDLIEEHFDWAYELFDSLDKKGKDEALDALLTWLPQAGTVTYTRQQRPLGLGHAIWCARYMVGDEPFAVILPDDLMVGRPGCLKQMVAAFAKTGGNIIATAEVPAEHTDRYGILQPGADDGLMVEIEGLVEKPKPAEAPSNLCIIGRYILRPEIFAHLDAHERGAGGEIQLTDAIAKMIGSSPCHGVRVDCARYDCGNKLGYLEAIVAQALARDDLADGVRKMLQRYV